MLVCTIRDICDVVCLHYNTPVIHPLRLLYFRPYTYYPCSLLSCTCDCLGCAVLLCLVCLFDLACFFLSSFSSLLMYMYMYMYVHQGYIHPHNKEWVQALNLMQSLKLTSNAYRLSFTSHHTRTYRYCFALLPYMIVHLGYIYPHNN